MLPKRFKSGLTKCLTTYHGANLYRIIASRFNTDLQSTFSWMDCSEMSTTIFCKVHDAFLTMTCVRKCWGALRAPLESLTRLQMDASFNSAGQEQIWQLVKRQALCLELMLENANLQLRQDQDYVQLDLCNISAAACRKNCLQKNQAIIQGLDTTPLEIESTELLFLSEEYRALLYNCYIVLQHEKEKVFQKLLIRSRNPTFNK